MTFNPNARIDPSRVTRRRGGGGGAGGRIAIGGGGLGLVGLIVVLLIQSFTGIDLSGLAGSTGDGVDSPLSGCRTGQDANADDDCLVAGTADSLDAYWSATLRHNGYDYRSVDTIVLFDGATSTACGRGTTEMGPFYCPGDETIYLDTGFFDELRTRFGASGGQLAKEYVVAHEWGHHIQQLLGTMAGLDLSDTGPVSDSVRLELQADCYAGAWVRSASTTSDADGRPYLQPPTSAQLADALDAAMVVGDDYIEQRLGGGQLTPERWTHGSSRARQAWFSTGYQQGVAGCGTFSAPADRIDPR